MLGDGICYDKNHGYYPELNNCETLSTLFRSQCGKQDEIAKNKLGVIILVESLLNHLSVINFSHFRLFL